MTKQDYIDEINEFFKTTENRVNWNGYASKKDAQKNGIENPTCTVDFLKDGKIVRTATCGTEVECLREICKEIYEAQYQENLKKAEEERKAYLKKSEEENERRRVSQMESDILSAIQDRRACMIGVKGIGLKQCCIGGVGFLNDNSKAIAVFQWFGNREDDNKKWQIIRENNIESFHIMLETEIVESAPAGFETDPIWDEFKQILCKPNFPKKENRGFLSKLFGKK